MELGAVDSRGQPYVTLSLLSTANATALPATSGARGTECYRRSLSIVRLVVGVPLGPCLREFGRRVYSVKIETLFDFLGPKLNFFSLTVCS